MITPENVLYHEIVGLKTKVVQSSDPTLTGLQGVTVFETRNTLSIRTGQSVKMVPKASATKIEVSTPSGACFISGSSLIGKPENRVSRL
jgi:ribonuclease P protein subunit POP4